MTHKARTYQPPTLDNIADVLRKANIRVTAVGKNLIELERSQREAELARDIARQMSMPVIELYETLHLPTDYPRTWEITFSVGETDGIHRPQSSCGRCGTDAVNPHLPIAQNHQSADNQDNRGRGEKPDYVPVSV